MSMHLSLGSMETVNLRYGAVANVYGIPLDEFARIRGFSNLEREKDEIYPRGA